ncbi:MAG: glycosyltransferase family 2 protein [Bacteroidota bacterium]|nr:glycosyltransferase family 2 protein [Bacteroidota bacterium]
MDIKKSVSIIIPNYNGRQLLEQYLPFTLAAIKKAGTVYEVIIVDDCSTDDSVAFIRSHYPELILVAAPENKGFSHACNLGIAASQYDLIMLLNSDVKLTEDYFEHQWKYFLRWDTFGVMGRIIDMDGDHIQDAARMPKFNGLKLKTDYFYYTNNENDRLFTFYLSGANALIDAAKLKQIGGFYEIFSPFYCEDNELGLRAWKLNWKCYYEHNAVCRHLLSASTKQYKTPQWVKSVYFRNRFYMHALHFDGLARFAWYFQITIVDLLPKLIIGQTWIWKSYRDLFKNRKLINEYRLKIKKLMDDNESHKTIFNVVDNIKGSVKNKKIVRFKS